MMKKGFLLTALVSVFALTASAEGTNWNDSYYYSYTYQTYTSLSIFNQPIETTDFDSEVLEAAIFYETNRQRVKYGLPQLKYDRALRVCAHNHSVDMVEYDFFSHTSPIRGKEDMSDRFAQVGYTNCACAENIALRSVGRSYARTAELLVAEQWMHSPGHRANILNSSYTHLGCGTAFYWDGSFLYVKATQNFLKK